MAKLLIVDDDRALTRVLAVRLQAAGYVVLTANNTDDGGVITLRERPDLIILDIDMPPYSGFEFQQCLKFADRGKNIPIIIVSGLDTSTNRKIAFEQGASGFIKKPIHWPQFLDTIRRVLLGVTKTVTAGALQSDDVNTPCAKPSESPACNEMPDGQFS